MPPSGESAVAAEVEPHAAEWRERRAGVCRGGHVHGGGEGVARREVLVVAGVAAGKVVGLVLVVARARQRHRRAGGGAQQLRARAEPPGEPRDVDAFAHVDQAHRERERPIGRVRRRGLVERPKRRRRLVVHVQGGGCFCALLRGPRHVDGMGWQSAPSASSPYAAIVAEAVGGGRV